MTRDIGDMSEEFVHMLVDIQENVEDSVEGYLFEPICQQTLDGIRRSVSETLSGTHINDYDVLVSADQDDSSKVTIRLRMKTLEPLDDITFVI